MNLALGNGQLIWMWLTSVVFQSICAGETNVCHDPSPNLCRDDNLAWRQIILRLGHPQNKIDKLTCSQKSEDVFFLYGGFLKWGYPKLIHFSGTFYYKPSSYGGTPFMETPKCILGCLVYFIRVSLLGLSWWLKADTHFTGPGSLCRNM